MCNNYKKLKSWDELTFTDDYMFKLVMSKHPKLISKILEIILQIKVKDIKFHETEKNLKESYDGHGIRFDLYVEDTESSFYVHSNFSTENVVWTLFKTTASKILLSSCLMKQPKL